MADTDLDTGQLSETGRLRWFSQTENLKRVINFNLDHLTWDKVEFPVDWPEAPEPLRGKVNFKEFYDHGLWTSFIDAGAFNILGVKLAPDYTIPRHHHNTHQLVLIHAGEAWQGSQSFHPGDGYFTRAEHPYSVTAGPEGVTLFEIRFDPIQTLTTVWDEHDPAKWVHGRRPGGPAHDRADL
jgi:hypothetical protein